MKQATKRFLNLAFAAFGTSAASFGAVWLLPVFEPCRMFYRTHNPIQDSPACKVFAAMNVLWAGSFLIGCGAAMIAAYLAARRRPAS